MSEAETTSDAEMPLLVSTQRTRQDGGVSERHVWKLIDRGLLTRRKVGESTKITSESVNEAR